MPTQKQIDANRRNAQKSTGPRSVEGKARSSQNALKSGIDAKAQVIHGESVANLQALTAEYYDRFHPTSPEQRMLVDTLIDADWLLRRFRACEAQIWKEGSEGALRPKEEIELGQAVFRNHNYFARLQRRIDSAHRNYRHALEQLRILQSEEAVDPAPATSHEQTAKPENGFVPQTSRSIPASRSPEPQRPAPGHDALP
jgi:hypothetical protein